MAKKSALVLFSGGQDSTVSLLWACQNFDHIETVGFNYNQRHIVEMKCRNIILKNIKKMSNKYNKIIIQDHIIDIPSLGKISETSLTRDSKIFIEDNCLPNTFVPGRNLLFFNYASALGWRRNIFDLVGGMCDTDYSGYPDCRRETINSLKQTLSLGLDKKIFIHTPLMDLNKADIWRLGHDLGGEKFQNILNVAPDLKDRTIIFNGVSKAYSMTGWRIGYAAGNKEIIKKMKTLQSQSTSCASSVSQYAAISALTQKCEELPKMNAEYKERHDYVVKELNNIPGVTCRETDGTFYVFPSFAEYIEKSQKINNDDELAMYLLNEGKVAVVPGSAFGMSGHLRLSIALDLKTLEIAMNRIKTTLNNDE